MKLRSIIILGLLLLAWNSCRHNETKAPLAKEAYGYARLDTLKQLLTINDETAKDTADAVKTYITTYADFGVGNEKIDLREKVYVYARESTVELVSHMDTDRLAGLLHGADKLALHNLPRSPMTYLVPGLAAILLLLYYIGYRMVLNMRMSGWLLLRTVWGFSVLMLVLMIIGLFAKWPVLGRETIPVKAEQMNGVISGTAVSTDILTGKPIGSSTHLNFLSTALIFAAGSGVFFCAQPRGAGGVGSGKPRVAKGFGDGFPGLREAVESHVRTGRAAGSCVRAGSRGVCADGPGR